MELVCATGNPGKVVEIEAVLAEAGVRALTLAEAGVAMDVVEDGASFEENAVKKAVEVMRACGRPVLADDSGLEVNALDGKPGVYSARWLGENTPYAEKNKQLLAMLENAKDRGARFVCVIAVAFPDGRVLTARGELPGEIARRAAGEGGFGYDPVFYVPAHDMTVAQMSSELKNSVSHRGQALAAIKEQLLETLGNE